MAYNTGNPLGSTDPRDLYDNAENFDRFANGSAPAYNDRLGQSRKSFAGMESEFAAFIAASGYEFVGDYAVGIEIAGYQQVVRDINGEFWRASGSTTLPYTTTGSGLPEGGAFVAVGDAVLRQELADTAGADLVGLKNGKVGQAIDWVTPEMFGAVGDGVADDTTAVQMCFNASKNVLITATHKILPTDGLNGYSGGVKPQDGSTVRFSAGAKFVMDESPDGAYVMVNLAGTTDVTIIGGHVIGDVEIHTATAGEFGMGFRTENTKNPKLINCKADKCWGDGFYIGKGTVKGGLYFCEADQNRRQGLSIVSWDEGLVLGGHYNRTGTIKATPPTRGIDIEPNPYKAGYDPDVINVQLIGVRTEGNLGGGLSFVPGFMSSYPDASSRRYNATLIDYTSTRDGGSRAFRFANPSLSDPNIDATKQIFGTIYASNIKIIEAEQCPVDFSRWAPFSPEVKVQNMTVIDGNTSGGTINYQRSGVHLYTDADFSDIGKVTLDSINVVDTRSVANTLFGVKAADNGSNTGMSSLTVVNSSYSGPNISSNSILNIDKSDGSRVVFDVPPEKIFSGSSTLVAGAWSGYLITSQAGEPTITIPPANDSVGLEYLFENKYNSRINLKTNAADSVIGLGGQPGAVISLISLGDRVKIRSIGGNQWQIIENIGTAHAQGLSPGKLDLWGTAAPTTGAWSRGDKIYSVVPIAGGSVGWVCVLSGTPGTWKPFGSIDV